MANIRNQALAWKNYLRNKQEEDERKKQEAETVAKVSALSNGLTTNQNANILRAATLGATRAAQNTSTFDQYRNALAQNRAKMQGLQNRVLAQNQAAARQVGIQKNPLMPQFNDKRAATFHEDVQRKAQNLWKEHKQNQQVNQYFDDNSVAGLTKKKQGYEDAAQKSKTNIQQYLKDAFAKDPDGERLINTFGLDEEYNDDDLRELWKNGMLSSQSFRESHPGVDWQGIDDNLGSYFENKTRSASTDADLLWQKTYENPEGLIKAAKGRDDYDKLVNSYNEDQFWAQRLSNYNNPDFNGDGRVADFIDEADRFENLGETAYDFRTVAGNRMATAREALADADQQAREKWIAKYGDSTADYINQKNIDYLIRAAREIGDSDLEGELSEIYAKAEAKSESLREGTDEVLAYLTKDEKDALKYWMQYGNETGDYTNANVLYEGLWAKSALRKRDSDTEDWKAYAERNGAGAWLNNRWQQFKSGVYAPFAGIAVQQHGEDAVFSKWFDPTSKNQVQKTQIEKNISDWINNTSGGKWFNENIGSALGCDAGDVANFFVDAAESSVDNVFRDLPAIAGVPGWHVFSLGVMSASSFNSTLYNDLMAGRDRESAMKHALAEGAIEYLTEKIGGEAATKWINDSGVLTYWLKTGGAEAVEELGGGIAGNFLERVNNDYHNGVWQGALQQVNADPSIGFMAALAQQQRAQNLEPVKAAASAFLSMFPNAVANVGTYRQMHRNEAMDEAQGEMYLNSDDVSQIQQLEAERSGLTDEQRELLAEQERRRSGSLEDRKAAMTEIMEREAQGQQTEEPGTTAPGPQVDITERKAGNIEEGRRNPYDEESFHSDAMEGFATSMRDQVPGPQQTPAERRAANIEEGQREERPTAPRRTPEQMREGNVEETTNQTPPVQQPEKQTPPGPQRKIDERKQANVEDGKKPKQKKSELAAMRERIAGMSDDAITARLGEIAERRASLEAELARRKDVVNKRGKTIEKLVKTATGAKVKAATADELLGETKQDSAVSTGDLGDGKTIKGLDKDGNIIASDGSTVSAKNVDWDAMPATKEVYDTAMELSEDYNVAPGVVFAAYADGMRGSVFRSGARAIVSAARAGTSLQNVLSNHRAAAALDPRMVQAMYDQAAEKGVQFARERAEVAAKLKPLESGEGNVSMTPEAAEFLKGLKPDNTILQSVQVINDLFGKHGPKIQFFLAGEGAEQGAINKAADTIRVALDAGDKGGMVQSAILQVLPHELTHMIATRYVDGYVKLQKYISDYLTSQGKSLDDYVENIRAEYKAAGVDLTAEQATEEAVAKASELVLKDSKFAERVANNNPSLANRIVDWLRSMKARIANIFKGYKPLSAIARDMQDAMDGYVKIWDDALEQALNIKREQAQNIETVKGDEGTAYTASNEEIGFHYELVNAFELTASNDYETMLENPLYPSELQPRDRSRQTSEDQIDNIVRDLNPNRLMGSSEVSTGAPIVGPDYIVESGNGRTIALQRVMKQGGKNAQKYTEALRQRVAEYGFKPEDVKDGQVLVRVRDSAMNNAQRAEFAKASNVSATMTSAAAETAASDAQKLSSKALDLYNPDGDVQSNADFYFRFLNEAIPASDRNSMLTRTGQPSQALIARAKAAMFYRAYGNNDLTAHMSEQADPEAKNAVSAMMNVAARVASIADQIQGGTLHDINFAADIANAAAQFIELKRTGQDVNDWLNQSSMFEQDDTMRDIVALMEKYKRSAVKLTGAFNSILDQVEAAGNPEQESLFGDDTLPTKQEIVKRAGEEDGTRFSLRSSDADYTAAVERGDMETAQRMVDEAARAAGYTIHAYHGTARGDRVGTIFRPDRATSGPMAYFTSDRTIAESYARNKQDTSLDYDEQYDTYETQFRVTTPLGVSKSIVDAWRRLSIPETMQIKEKAKHITFDYDNDDDTIIYNPSEQNGTGGFAQHLQRAKGNALAALVDEWLNSGTLFDREADFMKVLELAGVNEIFQKRGWSRVEYFDPNAKHEKVYDTYLRIQNPFVTNNMYTSEFLDDLEAWWSKQDHGKYARQSRSADTWDKNNRSVEEWIASARDDIEYGQTLAWTSIPDAVSDYLKSLEYDGIQDEGGKHGGFSHIVYIPFTSEQVKDSAPVVYDDAGNVIPLSERFNPENEDIRYSLRGDSELSDREVLGEALSEIVRTNGERLYLGKYQEAYNKLKSNQRDLRDQQDIMDENARYSNSQERIDDAEVESDRKKRNARYNEARNRAEIYQRRITEAEEALDNLEQDSRFQDLVKREIARAEASVNRDFENQNTYEQDYAKTIRGYEKRLYNRKRALQQYREDRNTSADRRRYIDRITDTVKDLSEMLAAKTDKKHVNAALEKPLGDFLNALNLYSKRYNEGGDKTQKDLKLSQYLRQVQDAVRRTENINEAGDYTGELYLPQGFVDQIANLAKGIEEVEQVYKDADPVVHMGNEALKRLDLTLRVLKKAIGDVNKLYTDAAYRNVSDMGRASIHYLNGFTPMSKRNGKFKRYLNWDMATPVYAMDRFGKVGQSLFKAIRDGYGQRAQRLNEIEEYAAEHWTAKEAKAWKEGIKTFTFGRVTDDGKHAPIEMKLTVSQIMELYLATKRDQAMKHIEVGGIRARTITKGSKTLINQPEAAHLSLDEIKEITGSLTDRQREVCDAMSKYMRTTSAWGNEVSMRRFGYRAFGEANYWPISTDEFSRDGVPEQGQVQGSNLYRLLNMTFTKALNPHANNALLLNGAFETFAAHATDMATYSTMALPALDMIKWYNFREKLDDGTLISTRGSMSRTYGDEAAKYIRNLISDFSGSTRTVERGTENQIYSKLMSHAKRAAVAGNLSVVLKQPGSILRAGYVLPRAMYLRPSALISRHDYNEMLEHSGIARWKSMGYFDTNLSKPMESKIAGEEKWTDKFIEIMTKGAEWADKNTMVSIWKAAKAQVGHDNKGMDRSGKEYFQKVTDLFEDIIYRTQVVDSTLTRSQSMRNPGFLGKTINAFMAEPTLSYNVMMDALTDVVEDHRQGKKGISKAAGKKIAVASTTYVMTQVVQALVGAMMGAWRDDDDYKTFMDKFWDRAGSSVLEEMNPINSIPLMSFLLDSLNGDNSSVADSGLVQLRYAYNGFKKVLWKDGKFNENWQEDMANDWQKLTRYSLSAASYLSGLPGMNLGREVWSVWNNTMDLTGNQELKFHPYSASDSNKARAGMLYDAVRSGDQARIGKLQKAMAANGTTEKVMGQFDDVVKEDLLAGNIGVDDAERLLIDYAAFDRTGTKSAYYKIQSWLWEAEGGHEYNFGVTARAKEALASGDANEIAAAYRELIDKYGKTEKDARSTMGECITELYKNRIINRRTAELLYRKYTDRTDKSIQQTLDRYE